MKKIRFVILFVLTARLCGAQPGFVWAKTFTGPSTAYAEGLSIALDKNENVYTTGYFEGTLDFDPGPGIYNLTANTMSIFISKSDASGNFSWVKMIGSNGQEQGKGIAVDPAGDILVTGIFDQTEDFDPGPGIFNLTATGSCD